MIHVNFDPQNLTGEQKTWWEKWEEKAFNATQDVIRKWEDTKKLVTKDFDNNIWGELKKWLLENVFNGKCAYCETHIKQARQSGHAEHYRPKGGVNYKEHGKKRLTKAIGEDKNGQSFEHPGYFWLAYNWKNLLPSCELCNSGGGKKNQFPVQKQHVLVKRVPPEEVTALSENPHPSSTWPDIYYLQPKDLDKLESPLLLHPYFNYPDKHLCFGHKGIEAPKENENGEISLKGKHSIEVYDLKNDDLRRARQKAQERAFTNFILAYATALSQGCDPGACKQEAWNSVAGFAEGKEAYSAAAVDYINLHLSTLGGG